MFLSSLPVSLLYLFLSVFLVESPVCFELIIFLCYWYFCVFDTGQDHRVLLWRKEFLITMFQRWLVMRKSEEEARIALHKIRSSQDNTSKEFTFANLGLLYSSFTLDLWLTLFITLLPHIKEVCPSYPPSVCTANRPLLELSSMLCSRRQGSQRCVSWFCLSWCFFIYSSCVLSHTNAYDKFIIS